MTPFKLHSVAGISLVCSIEFGHSEGQHSGNCGWPSSPHHSTEPRSEMCLIVPPVRTCVYPFRVSEGA